MVTYLALIGFFTPLMLAVYLAIPAFRRVWPVYKAPKPAEKPADFPDVWPNYFVAAAFYHNRAFGVVFLLALIADSILKVWILK